MSRRKRTHQKPRPGTRHDGVVRTRYLGNPGYYVFECSCPHELVEIGDVGVITISHVRTCRVLHALKFGGQR